MDPTGILHLIDRLLKAMYESRTEQQRRKLEQFAGPMFKELLDIHNKYIEVLLEAKGQMKTLRQSVGERRGLRDNVKGHTADIRFKQQTSELLECILGSKALTLAQLDLEEESRSRVFELVGRLRGSKDPESATMATLTQLRTDLKVLEAEILKCQSRDDERAKAVTESRKTLLGLLERVQQVRATLDPLRTKVLSVASGLRSSASPDGTALVQFASAVGDYLPTSAPFSLDAKSNAGAGTVEWAALNETSFTTMTAILEAVQAAAIERVDEKDLDGLCSLVDTAVGVIGKRIELHRSLWAIVCERYAALAQG